MTIEQLFFELIQVSLGTRICLSHTPSEDEWGELYAMAKKQSLVGVCFAGVQKLVDSEKEDYCGMPEMLFLTWMGMAAKIQQKNEIVSLQCVELCNALEEAHFRTCILKGQGTAALYRVNENDNENENPSTSSPTINHTPSSINLQGLRQSGDIDVWVMPKDVRTINESRPCVTEFVHRRFPDEKGAFVHIGYPCFSDTEVEVHYVPTMDGNPWVDRRFRRLFEERQDECFASTKLSTGSNVNELGFAVPEPMVNVLFNLHHVKRHFITSGIGLRHVIDLNFVLRSFNENENANSDSNVNSNPSTGLRTGSNENLCEKRGESSTKGSGPAVDKNVEIRHWIKKLGMKKFFAGIVWVMEYVLLNENLHKSVRHHCVNLGIKPDERLGRFILQEIMQGGNFGHHDERLKGVNEMGFWERWKHFLQVSIVRARYFPTEVLWSYVFRMRIGIWRKTGIEI